MLTASIPPAGAAAAAARCRSSSRSRRSRFQGRSATPTLTKEAPRRVAPRWRGVGLSRGKRRRRGRPNDGAARWRPSSWEARSTAGPLRGARHFHSGSPRSHSLRTLSLGQEAKTRLLRSGGGGGRRGTLRKAEVRVHRGVPTHALETLVKGQRCWRRLLSVFTWTAF